MMHARENLLAAFKQRTRLTPIVAAVTVFAAFAFGADAVFAVKYQAAGFTADVTPPVGHALLAGLCPPAKAVNDPLYAKGFVLLGSGKPIVFVSVDWCEIRNSAYDRWREALADAAQTDPQRVLVFSVHQHDAPLADLDAERILNERKLKPQITDLEFHERAVNAVADALREAIRSPAQITHVGFGKARVEQIASNRRYLDEEGKPHYNRMSTTRDPQVRARPEGTIDPWLRTVALFHGPEPVAALAAYATHPMSYYRTGRVSADFPGMARRQMQSKLPQATYVYASGAAGNVTVGKYNDGDHANRAIFAQRLFAAMQAAWENTKRQPVESIAFRSAPLRLEPRDSAGYDLAGLEKKLSPQASTTQQIRGALGLAWRRRADEGHRIDVPAIDLGIAQLLLLPAESYVEYQLYAGEISDRPVLVAGYGQCGPGYIPIERAWREGDGNLSDWCWVAPEAESAMKQAIRRALGKEE